MAKEKVPQSVPFHLLESNRTLWTAPAEIEWRSLDGHADYVISGSAFIDLEDPFGKKGNPFTVVTGPHIKDFTQTQRAKIAEQTGTPETIFINGCVRASADEHPFSYNLNLTVKTPVGKELGACAHGFTGAVQTLLDCEVITFPSVITITTTLGTTARASISAEKVISLEFNLLEQRQAEVDADKINNIFKTQLLTGQSQLPILSVGSPKITIELTEDLFDDLQRNLDQLDYDALLLLQNELQVNGIHLFCRNQATQLPQKVIQVNAYLGRENVVDPATGVSCAAQVSADSKVPEGSTLKLTQYTANGPSADLFITKKENGLVYVGGTAVLFNYFDLDER